MYFTGDDGSQNMFYFQPAINTLWLRKGSYTDYVPSWKTKRVYILLLLNCFLT